MGKFTDSIKSSAYDTLQPMDVIKNKKELAVTPGRTDALTIIEAGYAAINTETILKNKLAFKDGDLYIGDNKHVCVHYERIFFIGIGKCALEGAAVIEDILGENLTEGIVLDVQSGVLQRIQSFTGTHPYPSEANVSATKKIRQMIAGATEKDLVLVLISGGGSALLCDPYKLSSQTLVDITKELTKHGADIYELNTVRKHLSDIQGGQLAALAYPAQTISLIFSDVLGDDISMIASGPTVLDTTTVQDAKDVLTKYALTNYSHLEWKETPKDRALFNHVINFLIATNKDALDAMQLKSEELGYTTEIYS
ncbi:MAG: glycerate-2-kinase family protein, partial [Candidatus Paceibacterota bacterium]